MAHKIKIQDEESDTISIGPITGDKLAETSFEALENILKNQFELAVRFSDAVIRKEKKKKFIEEYAIRKKIKGEIIHGDGTYREVQDGRLSAEFRKHPEATTVTISRYAAPTGYVIERRFVPLESKIG